MPKRVRRVLRRALHHQRPTRHATWQTCGGAMRAIATRYALRSVWQTWATCVLWRFATFRWHVRSRPWCSNSLAYSTRIIHSANCHASLG